MTNRIYIRLFLIILFLKIVIPEINLAQNNTGFTDTAAYYLYIKDAEIAKGTEWMDENGNYESRMVLSVSGQKLVVSMKVIPDEYGEWKTIEIENSSTGDIIVHHSGNKAVYTYDGEKKLLIFMKIVL